MMTKISPRSMTKSRSCWMTKLPYAIVRRLTRMRGVALEAEGIEDDGEDPVQHDDAHDRRHHGRGRRETDRRGAPTRLHPAQTPGERDHDAEHRALRNADQEVTHVDRRPGLLEVLDGAEVQQADADHGASQDADQIRVKGE